MMFYGIKSLRCFIIVALLTCVLSPKAVSVDLYVTADAEPGGDGSLFNPWRTIGTAVMEASDGDVINIAAGLYPDMVLITNSITLIGEDTWVATNHPLLRNQSRTIMMPPNTNRIGPMITVSNINVKILNMTFLGDGNGDGIPTCEGAINSFHRPLIVSNCTFRNFNRSAIANIGRETPPQETDDDSLRSYFGYNLIHTVTATNTANGILLDRAPATCEYNAFANIAGPTAHAALYIHECKYASNMTKWITLHENYFSNCTMSIWANFFGGAGDKIIISSNKIEDGLIGIRITSARGQAVVIGNEINVSGVAPTPKATPARGIWVEADADPWNPTNATDHLLLHNIIKGQASYDDGTLGLLIQYDSPLYSYRHGSNNGARVTAHSNVIFGFDTGIYMLTGTNGVTTPADPLVDAVFHWNDVYHNQQYSLFATGFTHTIDATDNFLGFYIEPPTNVSGSVDYAGWTPGSPRMDTDGDGITDDIDPDSDGDGIPDIDEVLMYGTYPYLKDSDGDGHDDWQEIFVTGTDPLNAQSIFKILAFDKNINTNMVLTWSSITNKVYSVWRSTNLLEGFLLYLDSVTGSPPTNVFIDVFAPENTPCFYKVTVTN